MDTTQLSKLTPDRITTWMSAYLKVRVLDPVDQKRATHTVNSLVRNARSLFSARVLERLKDVKLPKPLPFEGVRLLPAGSMRYQSKMDPIALLEAAKAELSKDQPEVFKAFILCLLLCLRRSEADLLLWESVDWTRKVLRIERTQYFTPKSEFSQGELPMDDALYDLLKQWHAESSGPFVLESRVQPRTSTTYEHYWANKHFKALIRWLKEKGMKERTPIHTLRKEYGRLITEQHGIYAASRMLRHGSIQITAAHYADDTRRLSSGLEVNL